MKAKKCCLDSTGWNCRPSSVNVNPENTDNRHPKCFLGRFGGCSDTISGEHFLSEGLLRALQSESDDGAVQVSGHPWTTDGAFVGMAPSALKANILCSAHNSRLHPLDDQGLRLFNVLRRITLPERFRPGLALFNGYDIERWMFKTLCGYLLSGVAQCDDGTRVAGNWFPDNQLALIADAEKWRTSVGCGLFYLGHQNKLRVHAPRVQFGPVVTQSDRSVEGARLEICGFEFLLAASPRAIHLYRERATPIYRPGKLRVVSESGAAECMFSWNDGKDHGEVLFKRAGELVHSLP